MKTSSMVILKICDNGLQGKKKFLIFYDWSYFSSYSIVSLAAYLFELVYSCRAFPFGKSTVGHHEKNSSWKQERRKDCEFLITSSQILISRRHSIDKINDQSG